MTDLDVLFVQTKICPRTRKEARALTEAGVRVHLLETHHAATHQDYAGFETHNVLGEPNDMRGLVTHGRRIRRRISEHLAAGSYDIVHTHNGPDALGAWLPRLGPGRFVHDVHDIQTFIPTTYAHGARRMLIDRLKARWERQACQRADAVFTVSPWMARHLAQRHGLTRTQSFENKVFRAPHDRLPRRGDSDGRTHIIYAGGFHFREGEARSLLPDMRIWADAGIHVHVYPVFFDERDRDVLRQKVHDEPLITVHDLCPQDRFVAELTQYDWGLIWFRETTRNILMAAPNRLYELQVAQVPVLTNLGDGFTGTYVREKGCGVVVADAHEALHEMKAPHTFRYDTTDCYMDGHAIRAGYESMLDASG